MDIQIRKLFGFPFSYQGYFNALKYPSFLFTYLTFVFSTSGGFSLYKFHL